MMAKQRDVYVLMGASSIPKERLDKFQGEDAFFLCKGKKTFGLADGVGGWSKKGIDAGEYSRELMTQADKAVQNEPSNGVDLYKVLNYAYWNTKEEGSSTACLITVKNRTLHALNVGDSGFRVLREGDCVYRSPIQQTKFNHPYQLGTQRKNPSCAQALEVPVEDGDIVIAGTDGLFDNLCDGDIERVVKEATKNGISAEDLAYTVASQAYLKASDKYDVSPFEVASKTAKRKHVGGKMDDITVIVAFIL